jgi:flagellar hook-associated protein 2
MPTLSSPGIGSGLDIRSMVSQLMAIERRPLEQLQVSTKRLQDQLSAYGRLESAMAALRDAARKLADAQTWTATTVASSNPVAVAATSDGTAPPGSYAVNVTTLATAQTLSGPTLSASGDSLGNGTLTIQLGTWGAGQTSFTPKPDADPVSITIAPGNDSLAAVRDAINAAGAGVTASVLTDANGSRLVLRSDETGAAGGFRITVNDNDGDNGDIAGLSALAFDPSAGVSQATQNLGAANAALTINGVPVSAAGNRLEGTLDGLTLTLGQATTTPVDLSVKRDTDAVKKIIGDFATAYNDVIKLLREQTRYDESSQSAGPLQADASAVALLRQLRTLAGASSGATSAFARLADAGLTPQRDGTLQVDSAKLDAAIANLGGLKDFFARDEDDAAADGFGVLFKDFGNARLASDGSLSTRQEALRDRIDRNNDRAARIEDRLALVEKRLNAQYTRLDADISRLASLQNYVAQQIANWNKSSG